MTSDREKNSARQLKLGALAAYFSVVATALAGLFYMPWLLRVLGKDVYGLYALATSLVAIFLFDFGMSQSTTRFLAKFNAQNDVRGVENFLGIVYKLYFAVDVAIALAFFVAYFFLDDVYAKLTPEQLADFKKVYVAIAIYGVVSFPFVTLNGLLTSYEKFVWVNGLLAFNRIFIVAATIVSLALGFRLFALVAVQILAGLIAIALKLFAIRKYTTARVNFAYFDKETLKSFFGYSGWTTLCALSQRLMFCVAPSILGAFADSAAIGLFGVAYLLEGYFANVATAINDMFLPKVSRIVAAGEKETRLLPLAIRVCRFQLFALGAFFFGFVLLGMNFIADIWLTNEYRPVYYCVLMLVFPCFFSLPQRIGDVAIMAENKVRAQSIVYVAAAVLNVVLSLVLAYFFGLYGATAAIFIAYLFRSIAMSVAYHRVVGLNMFAFFRRSFLSLAPFFVLVFLGGTAICWSVPTVGLVPFLAKGAAFVAYYLLLAYFVGFNRDEKRAFVDAALKPRRFLSAKYSDSA